MDGMDEAGSCDSYDVQRHEALNEFAGRLFVAWGEGFRAWVQRADKQNKAVTELHLEFKEPAFPGFLVFLESLSRLDQLHTSWIEVLRQGRGIYLLSCPKTREQYVGSATGEGGAGSSTSPLGMVATLGSRAVIQAITRSAYSRSPVPLKESQKSWQNRVYGN